MNNLENLPITIEQFMKNIDNGVLAFIRCECGAKRFLTVPICTECGKACSDDGKWEKITSEGEIKTYCVVYVGPPELKDISPYCSVIVSFGEGLQISAILDEKIDFMEPPTNLIGKKIKPSFIKRDENHNILGMKFCSKFSSDCTLE